MTVLRKEIIDTLFDGMRQGRPPAPGERKEREAAVREPPAVITGPQDALDRCGALFDALRETGALPADCALTYAALALMRYLWEKLPPGADKATARERWKHLDTPLKTIYVLSDRAGYTSLIAKAAGKLRETMRTLIINDDGLAFSVANLLRQTAVETGAVPQDSPWYRHCLALLDYLEQGGAPGVPGRPSYANGGRVPRRPVFEVKTTYTPQQEEPVW